MKVLIAIDNFKIGGAERVASLIANELAHGHEVHAAIFEDEIRYPIDARVILHNVSPEGHGKIVRGVLRLWNYVRLIKRVKPEAIYAFAYVGIYAAVALKLAGKNGAKLICSERTDPRREPASRLTRFLMNWAYSQSDTLVCQTAEVVDYFRQKGLKTTFAIIPNPVKEDLPEWHGAESKTFITACRLAPQKNLPMMLRAFKEFKASYSGYHLTIYGDGPDKEMLLSLIGELELQDEVKILPFETDIHRIMAESFAYLSTSDYEGISNSMLEALAVGMPTVCTDCPVGGAAMFIRSGINGFLCPVGDTDGFAQILKSIVTDSCNLSVVSANAKAVREILHPQKIVQTWTSLA